MGFSIPNLVRRIFPTGKGTYFFEISSTENNYDSELDKLKAILQNPAALFLLLLLPDLYSMGVFKLYKENDLDTEIEKHPILDLLKNPNPMQTDEQFKWDYMFWRLLGSANMLGDSKVLQGEKNILYWLSPDCIKWPKWFDDNAQTLFFSKQAIRELEEKIIEYETTNQKYPFKYKYLKQFFDISNGVKGWFKPPSRVDALHKIIKNSDNVLDSKNINSHLARKFLVAGKHDVANISTLPLGSTEKNDIQEKVFSTKAIHAVKSMVEIKRFLEDVGSLSKLDQTFLNDAFLIGKMYNIPRDVIERFEDGATYENQEKARAAVVSYCIQPAADDFCRGLMDYYNLEGFDLRLDYSHLPFVQTFEEQRAKTLEMNASAFQKLVMAGADQVEAAEMCGFEFTAAFTEPRSTAGSGGNSPDQDQVDEQKLKKIV